jgi:large subunit ribosomal protein L7/L12
MATAVVSEKSTSAVPLPVVTPKADSKINSIVDDISGLTLLQAADLVAVLKVCKFLS